MTGTKVGRCGGCGQWVEDRSVCGVCVVDGCVGCGHPVEWHGRFGCRGWHLDERCACRLDEADAVVVAVAAVVEGVTP